jgi:hydrogenase maturation protein HypF
VLAVGAQQKSTVALSVGSEIVVSQHLGDLHTPAGAELVARTVEDLVGFFGVRPTRVACDLHPDYTATRLAERLAAAWVVPLERVQHHHAHVAACMAEHGLAGPVLGLAWDGAGLGPDGLLWGGEALVVDGAAARRVAHLRSFRLPGGDAAVREPRRAALGILHALYGEEAAALARGFAPAEAALLCAALARGVNAPTTTAMGRLFDALAALAGVRLASGFEGEAAMALEFAGDTAGEVAPYPFPLADGVPAVADWGPLVAAALADRTRGASPATIAARFHAALVDLAETIAVRAGLARVVLTGGCFQNWRLADQTTARLRARGFTVYLPQAYPPNDGGIALGQLIVAAHRARSRDGAAPGAQRPGNARPPTTAEAGRESGHAGPRGFGAIGAAPGAPRPSRARAPKT